MNKTLEVLLHELDPRHDFDRVKKFPRVYAPAEEFGSVGSMLYASFNVYKHFVRGPMIGFTVGHFVGNLFGIENGGVLGGVVLGAIDVNQYLYRLVLSTTVKDVPGRG